MPRKALHTPAMIATLGALWAPGVCCTAARAGGEAPSNAGAPDRTLLALSDGPFEEPPTTAPGAPPGWLLRLDSGSSPDRTAETAPTRGDPGLAAWVTNLRFHEIERGADAIDFRRRGMRRGASDALLRLELAPSFYLAGGRLLQDDDAAEEYPDVYAELAFDLSANTGVSLGYQHLRQALGDVRPGEVVDPEALFLKFELRF